MRGRKPSADSVAGMAGGGCGRLPKQSFWPPGDKSRGFGGGAPNQRCCRAATSWHFPRLLLELGRGHIAPCRVEPFFVVHAFDECTDRCVGIRQVSIFAAVDFLLFERFHETLGLGVVVGVCLATHAAGDTVLLQPICVGRRDIRHAAVGVMRQPRRRLPLPQRHA